MASMVEAWHVFPKFSRKPDPWGEKDSCLTEGIANEAAMAVTWQHRDNDGQRCCPGRVCNMQGQSSAERPQTNVTLCPVTFAHPVIQLAGGAYFRGANFLRLKAGACPIGS